MKPTPTLFRAWNSSEPITRDEAANLLRRERREGNAFRISTGIVLSSQHLCLTIPKPPPPYVPHPFSLSMRLTHKYVTGWDSLDKWHDLGTAIVERLNPKRWYDGGESYRQLQILKVDAHGYRPGNVMRAIEATLSSSCRCEHDCCGCVSSYALRIRPLCGDRYAVLMSGYRNI
jgi:hypothetical protein